MNPLACPHCACEVFKSAEGGLKLKARTSILVLHKGTNDVEINCPGCSRGILVPLMPTSDIQIRKAAPPRFVARRS